MSRIKTIFTLIIIVLLSIFAVQNYATASIKFLMYSVDVSLAIVIVLSAAIGVIIGLVVGLNRSIKDSISMKNLTKEQDKIQEFSTKLNDENMELREKIESLESELSELKNKSIVDETTSDNL